MVRIYKLRRHYLYLLPAQQDAFEYAHDNIMKIWQHVYWIKMLKKSPQGRFMLYKFQSNKVFHIFIISSYFAKLSIFCIVSSMNFCCSGDQPILRI